MELFDVLDSNGKPTGKIAERGYQCLDNEYYLSAHVYIYNSNNEFLLQKRSSNKKFLPDTWEILLEHAITSENGVDTAKRGLYEEYGLDFDKSEFQYLTRIMWNAYHHLTDIYFLKADIDIHKIKIQMKELSALKWVSKEDMLLFVSTMRNYRPEEYVGIVSSHIMNL